jgi:FkbM family methyltransferase
MSNPHLPWAKPLAAVVGGACAVYLVASGAFSRSVGPSAVEVNSPVHNKALASVGGVGADSATVAALTAQIAGLTAALENMRAQVHTQTVTCAQAAQVAAAGTGAVATTPCPALPSMQPAPVCPACPSPAPPAPATTAGSAIVDPHGLAVWRQTAYTMAPFVYPHLYQCIKTAAEVPQAPEWRSQSHEDQWLWNGFFSKLPQEESWAGTFIEIGAIDGNTYSNTWFFEKNRDWRGLLIEAHPVNSVGLRANQAQRPNAAIFTAAVCGLSANGSPGTLGFTQNGGAVGAAVELANEKFLRGWHGGQTSGSFPVSCVPLQSLLDSTGIHDVDIFSLDVEGAELAVLQTIDWAVTNVRVIIVELDGDNAQKDEAVRVLLRQQGFVPTPWGGPRDACVPGQDCTSNEAYLNERYMERKKARVIAEGGAGANPHSPFHPSYSNGKYRYGTGVKC